MSFHISESLGGRHPLSHNFSCTSDCNLMKLFTKILKHFASVHLHWSTFLIRCNFGCLEQGMKDCRSVSYYSFGTRLWSAILPIPRMKYWDFDRIYFTLCMDCNSYLAFWSNTLFDISNTKTWTYRHSCWCSSTAMHQLLKFSKSSLWYTGWGEMKRVNFTLLKGWG